MFCTAGLITKGKCKFKKGNIPFHCSSSYILTYWILEMLLPALILNVNCKSFNDLMLMELPRKTQFGGFKCKIMCNLDTNTFSKVSFEVCSHSSDIECEEFLSSLLTYGMNMITSKQRASPFPFAPLQVLTCGTTLLFSSY